MGELTLRPAPAKTGRAAGPSPLGALGDNLVTTTLDKVINWGRSSAIWPALFGLACCAIEMMGTVGPRHDLSRFGSELFRASPRQADLMIVAGRVSIKMAPVLRQLYDQMPDPKWVISMGACANFGGPFDTYATLQGVDRMFPVDVYVSGCPPTPEALIAATLDLQNRVIKYERVLRKQGPEAAQNLRQAEREAAGLKQVVSLRQAGPAAHTVLVKGPEGETRALSTLRRED